MKNESKIIIIPIFCFLMQSCTYHKMEINWAKYNDCDKNLNADTTAMANKLVGKWLLKAYFCFWTPGGTHYPETRVVAEFTSDRKFTVTENGSVISQGKWCFGLNYYKHWYLANDGQCTYFVGLIEICDNHLVFWDSYRDGCDNLFERIK